jgi:non-specific serine/threonine protein kinase/serine/threonine-protein kinase
VLFDYHDAIATLPGSTPVRQKLVSDALQYLNGLSERRQDEDLEREIALAYVKVADVQGNSYNPNLGDTAGGTESARKAVAHAEPLYRKEPSAENAYVLGRSYLVLAILIHSSDQIAGAEEYYKRAVEMFEKAVGDHWDEAWQTRHIEALAHLGDLYGLDGYANLGRTKDALAAYTRARDLSADLVKKHPDSRDAQEVLFLTELSVAEVDQRLGQTQRAVDSYRSAIAVNEKMLGDGPATPSDQQNLASAYFALGNQLLDDGNSREALPFLQRSHDLVQQIAEGDPRNALFQKSLAIKNLGLCRVIRAMNEAGRALSYCREGLVSLQKLSAADPGSGDKRLAVADALRQLDETKLAAHNASVTPARKRR